MNNIATPCMNTAKMLGASSREALEFGDACFVLQNNINQELKKKARQTILKTNLHGKSFEKWLEEMHGIAKSNHENTNLLNIVETKEGFVYGVVEFILSTLITRQFHEKAA